MGDLLIRRARLRGQVVAVRVSDGRIAAVQPSLRRSIRDDRVVDADGATLLPGLHDHHLHLLATAAAQESVECGPAAAASLDALGAVLRQAAAGRRPGEWVRATGYHESTGGDLDRDVLDHWVRDHPLRIQHRSGALWVLNSAGLAAIGAGSGPVPPGLEHDRRGRLTGRLWREDRWLRERTGPRPPPDLTVLGRHLASLGVTGVTDATPDFDRAALSVLVGAVASDALPQRVALLGADRSSDLPAKVTVGARKVIVPDHDLPDLPALVARLTQARDGGTRPVAVHCVTRLSLVLLVAALDEIGTVPGDRIEHASVVPADLLSDLRRLGVSVVTQPGLVAARGDAYLRDVDAEDRPHLYRHASLLAAGIPVGMSTDAPYTLADPWQAMRAAVDRRTLSGAVLGADERVSLHVALRGFLTAPRAPGGPVREIGPGAVADVCLVDNPSALRPAVHLTVVGGQIVHSAVDVT